jgi:hypothetical protein
MLFICASQHIKSKGLLIGGPLTSKYLFTRTNNSLASPSLRRGNNINNHRSSNLENGHQLSSWFRWTTHRRSPLDSRNVKTRIKIDDGISKKDSHILGHKQLFQ